MAEGVIALEFMDSEIRNGNFPLLKGLRILLKFNNWFLEYIFSVLFK